MSDVIRRSPGVVGGVTSLLGAVVITIALLGGDRLPAASAARTVIV
jgi:hypothetical protein